MAVAGSIFRTIREMAIKLSIHVTAAGSLPAGVICPLHSSAELGFAKCKHNYHQHLVHELTKKDSIGLGVGELLENYFGWDKLSLEES